VWTVFRNPADYPGKWVLRATDIGHRYMTPRQECVVADTLDDARAGLPAGLICVGRAPTDDPVIHESWL
jgi:hypothetical protein